MKTKEILFSISGILFFILLYHEIPGINFLIFSIFLVSASYLYKKANSPHRILISVFLLISCFSVALYADPFSIIMSLGLFFLLPVFVHYPNEKLIMAPLQSFSNFALSFLQLPEILSPLKGMKDKGMLKFFTYFIIPVIILFFFALIYRTINVDFKAITDGFEIKDIDFEFFVILAMSLIYSIGFWYYYKWIPNKLYEEYTVENIQPKEEKQESESIWAQSGIIVFSLLNLLLLVLIYFECTEIYCREAYLSLNQYSEEVHLSIQSVIGSILIAVFLIMLYLKGNLNFGKLSIPLKLVSSIWVILNFILVITTFLKNEYYVSHLGLTEKRLGVYAFLLLACIGLGFTLFKIYKSKSNYFLIKSMAWVVLTFLVSICPINWSAIITNNNVELYEKTHQKLDLSYVGYALQYNYPQLKKLEETHPELNDSTLQKILKYKETNLDDERHSFLSENLYRYSINK